MKTCFFTYFTCTALLLATGGASGAEFWLCAVETTRELPDETELAITQWGFVQDTDQFANGCSGEAQIPGPLLSIPPDDETLTIHLANNLPTINGYQYPVSLVIQGQEGTHTDEVLPDAPKTFTWNGIQPGTHLYYSGSHPGLEVPMGLYGGIKKDAGLGEAYAGIVYDNEVLVFYSEMDSELYSIMNVSGFDPDTVDAANIQYQPRYYSVNGEYSTNPDRDIPAGNLGQTTLIRFLNVGLSESRSPVLLGTSMTVIAEDARLNPMPTEVLSLSVASGHTLDAIVSATTDAALSSSERMLLLTMGSVEAVNQTGFPLDGEPQQSDDVSILKTMYRTGSEQLLLWAASDASPGVTLSLPERNTEMVYFVPWDYFAAWINDVSLLPDSVTVVSSGGGTDTKPIPYVAPPIARNDSYSVLAGDSLIVSGKGVLENDNVGGWFEAANTGKFVIQLEVNPANGTLDINPEGFFGYAPDAGFTGEDSFTYRADIGGTLSNVATVTIRVAPEDYVLPVATDDTYSVEQGSTLAAIAPGILENDAIQGDEPPAVKLIQRPIGGTLLLNTNGSFTYRPVPGFTDVDAFSYQILDTQNNVAQATATIQVTCSMCSEPIPAGQKITLAWNPSPAPVIGYLVYYGPTADRARRQVSNIQVNSPSFNPDAPSVTFDMDRDLILGDDGRACFRVRAYDSTVISDFSESVCNF